MSKIDRDRRLAAILFADLTGYTERMAKDEEATHDLVKEVWKTIFQPSVGEKRGRIVKYIGDAILAEFGSAIYAVGCAVEIQRRLMERNACVPEESRLKFRMGINVGDIIVEGDDVHGNGVIIAQRLQSSAEPGGIYISSTVFDHISDRPEFEIEPLGFLELKGVPRPVEAFRIPIHQPVTETADVRPARAASPLLDERQPLRWQKGIYAETALLSARYAVVPLRGREAELANIEKWCADPSPIGVRLYWGAGGMGKTRLWMEACAELRKQGWSAGFLSRQAVKAAPQALDALFHAERLVLVLDYAESRQDEVATVVDKARKAIKHGRMVRLVLLARRVGDWWDELRRSSLAGDVIAGPAVEIVPERDLAVPADERHGFFHAALTAFGETLEVPPREVTPDLRHARFGRPLFLQLAAYAALRGQTPDNEQSLLDVPLDRERRLWGKYVGAELAVKDVAQAAAFTVLAGTVNNEASARKLVGGAPRLRGRSPEAIDRTASLLHLLCPGPGWLNGLDPDLLGEHLVSEEIEEDPDLLAAFFDGPGKGYAEHALTVLTRLAQRNPDRARWLERALVGREKALAETAIAVAVAYGDPLGQVLAKLLNEKPDPRLALALADKVPWQTVVLRELGLVTAAQAVAALEAVPEPRPREVEAELARLRNTLAYRLVGVGAREEAASVQQQAAETYRDLAEKDPDAFRPGLAGSLNNLAGMLSDLGRREDALAVAQEAADIYRDLAARNPDAFRPDLAGSLNNVAQMLSGLGQREEALDRAREAADIYRDLTARNPDSFRPALATSLNNLANRLSDLGRREEALAAAKEAVDIRRDLAARRPDAFRPDLAGSLNNLAAMLSGLGRREEALDRAQEAVDIRRDLAARHPDAFRPALAASLNNLANMLRDLGRREDALAVAQEAADIYRDLAARNPDAFRPDLASSLNNLAAMLSDLGRCEEALGRAQEAVEIRRGLAARNPDAFRPDLAMSLNNLAAMLSDLGRREEALANAKEAVDIRRDLAARQPDAFKPYLAGSLNNLANILSDLGRREDALAAAQEAADIYRDLAARRPDAFRPALAMSLNTLAIWLGDSGRRDEALLAAREAVEALAPYFERSPLAHAAHMRTIAGNYLKRCQEYGTAPDDALLAPIAAKLAELEKEAPAEFEAGANPST